MSQLKQLDVHHLYKLPFKSGWLNQCILLLSNPGALGLLVNKQGGLREDDYHWTELPSLNRDYYNNLFILIDISIMANELYST